MALNDGIAAKMFHGVKIGSLNIHRSHLFYVGDVIIILEWNQTDMENIFWILNVFYIVSGLKINIHKSNVFSVGVSNSEIVSMAAYTGCEACSFPFSCLGLPIGSNIRCIGSKIASQSTNEYGKADPNWGFDDLVQQIIEEEDDGNASDDEKATRINKLQELDNLEKLESMDLVQKGMWLSEPTDIKEAFLNFYKDKFSCHDSLICFLPFIPAHRLNISDRDFLEAMVFMDEIKTTVWDCGSHKALGLDGYSFMFIEKFWDLLKHDIHMFAVNFFSTSTFSQGANSAFITLIPKVKEILKKDKIRSKQDKNGKRGKAEKSQKQLQ
nr:RNA-directed DNA polymerase, eukaryota, reverse transcriptase zinc-binding domain protein [Tanacetum cinerariifolium]